MKVSKYFSDYEFICRCGCGLYLPNEELLSKLDALREALAQPVLVTSGTRCPGWNLKVGGKPSSAHLAGEAADITTLNAGIFEIVKLFYLAVAVAGFKRAGIDLKKLFIHVDVSKTLPPGFWYY